MTANKVANFHNNYIMDNILIGNSNFVIQHHQPAPPKTFPNERGPHMHTFLSRALRDAAPSKGWLLGHLHLTAAMGLQR
jgi:hypothetical protein